MSRKGYQNFVRRLSGRKKQEVEVVIKQMAIARDKYKKIINEYYTQRDKEGSLFLAGRSPTKENFKEDIANYDEMVEHCLRAGDAEILYKWGLGFLAKQNGIKKLASQDVIYYVKAFQRLIDESTHTTERIYMTLLRDAFAELVTNPNALIKNSKMNFR
ncbi:MAG: hypothetical protein F6K00_34845 [Leptolyngbya sp. SIOISBB]|nr:hypothetical protein [Leptolyngbya sp. SIOISBB]